MADEPNKQNDTDQAQESAEKAAESAEKAETAADVAKEAAQEVKEEVKEQKAEVKEEKASKTTSASLEKIIKSIEELSVLELSDLVKALEEKFGVSAAAPMAMAVGGPAAAGAGEETSEQTTFNVVLAESGANKISVIKAVRELVPTLGLKEAKDLVDTAPKPVLEGVNKETANEAKTKLETAGAKVELK